MDNYMDSTSPEYVRRMASSLNAKWEALAPYVTVGTRVLDYGCGMPVQGGIRERVEAAGSVYECHDISTTVETAMRDAGAAFRTREDLQERAGGYDVVFLSSVMHEILAGESWFEDLEFIRDLAAPGGVLIVRDWAGPNYQIDNEDPKSLKVVSEDAMREVLTWIGALAINKIVHFKGRCTHPVLRESCSCWRKGRKTGESRVCVRLSQQLIRPSCVKPCRPFSIGRLPRMSSCANSSVGVVPFRRTLHY